MRRSSIPSLLPVMYWWTAMGRKAATMWRDNDESFSQLWTQRNHASGYASSNTSAYNDSVVRGLQPPLRHPDPCGPSVVTLFQMMRPEKLSPVVLFHMMNFICRGILSTRGSKLYELAVVLEHFAQGTRRGWFWRLSSVTSSTSMVVVTT
jgi:hypothetical protein